MLSNIALSAVRHFLMAGRCCRLIVCSNSFGIQVAWLSIIGNVSHIFSE